MKINNLNTNKNKGFILLYALIISGVILAIALSVADISFKELSFSATTKANNDAYFAADTGADCAVYYSNAFGKDPNTDPYPTPWCQGNVVDTWQGHSSGYWDFVLVGLGPNRKTCAKVRYEIAGSTYTITSKGYNLGGDTSDCTSSSTNRTEIVVQLTKS